MARRLTIPVLLVALALFYGVVGHTAAIHQQSESGPLPAVQSTSPQWLGVSGCTAVGCHNANAKKGDLHSEYATWALHDPHTRAYQVLLNAKSREIVERLYPESGKKAHELGRCLDCHVHQDYDKEKTNHYSGFSKEEGVSCESCHGPAGNWISEHYKPGLTEKQKSDLGLWDTRSLAGRVRNCAACHIGKEGMEVNHDLIAAGHPRLAFEFSAFHSMMPHHWQDAKDKQPGASNRARADWDAAAWFVGQAVTSQVAVELLAARARSTIWPEFSETDCYACHHQLENQSWRRDPDLRKGSPGSLPWNTWYINSLVFGVHPGKATMKPLPPGLGELRETMQKKAAPDKDLVRLQAAAAIRELEGWVKVCNDGRYPPKVLKAIVRKLTEEGAQQKPNSWDEAAQRYLALASAHYALRESTPSQAPPDLLNALKAIRARLEFPTHRDSPGPRFTPDWLQEEYKWLQREAKGP